MPKKEALRDLQARLAQKMQQAQSQGVAASWLAVEVAGQNFLLPLELAGEIFTPTPIQKVPYALPWFVGVANLRGGLYGVVDLGSFFGSDTQGARRLLSGDALKQEARLVGFNAALGLNCVLLVTRLLGLRHPSDFQRMETAASGAEYLSAAYYDEQGGKWQELNLQNLATASDFLAIAA